MTDPNEVLSELAKIAGQAETWNKSERLRAVPGIWMLIDTLENYIAENDVHELLYARQKLGLVKSKVKQAFEGEDDPEEVKRNLFELFCAVGNLQVGILGTGEVPKH
jgi:hypothetical protein